MTDTSRARLLATALDAADNAATVLAGAAAGLTTYRLLAARPMETRLAVTAAAGALALCLTDQATTLLRRPLRARLGLPPFGYATATATDPAPVAAPTLEQLAAEAAVDAAHRAATHAHHLDRGSGSLTQAANWVGQADGSAACELADGARLLCLPSPTDRYGTGLRTYHLATDAESPIEVHTLAELVALLDRLTEADTLASELDDDEDEHYAFSGQDPDAEPDDEGDQELEDHHQAVTAASGWGYSEEPPF
ncbi:hypothetical protein ACWCYY_34920 [Kitasatospora sp. NPDC001664]